MAIVLPIVTTFFLAFCVLEDSGYLPRLAVMVNQVFKRMGLNGKAVLPMVLGLGCDTMATMTARIMETRKERVIVTLLLALAVPCSAQLAVILAMTRRASPSPRSLWFAAVIARSCSSWSAGWRPRSSPGAAPTSCSSCRRCACPSSATSLVKTLARIEWYLREALPLFVLGTLLLWGLDRVHMLAVAGAGGGAGGGRACCELPKEAASAFILGFLRRDYAAAGLFAHYQPYMSTGHHDPGRWRSR